MTAAVLLLLAAIVVVLRHTVPERDAEPEGSPMQRGAPRGTQQVAVATELRQLVDGGAPKEHPALEARATFSWGSGKKSLGRARPQEGNPEAPMSVMANRDGTISIVDQVNHRIVRVDAKGETLATLEIPVQAAQDIATTADGKTIVLDRLVDKSIAIIGPDGTVLNEVPIVGKGLPESGAATAVLTIGDEVLVEKAHGDTIRVATLSKGADPNRPVYPGRPSRDGRSFLTATIISAREGRLIVTSIARDTLEHRFTKELTAMGRALLAISLLDSDAQGTILVGVLLPGATAELPPSHTVWCLDGTDGHLRGEASFPANTDADETLRELTVSDDGTIYFLHRTEAAAELLSGRCG